MKAPWILRRLWCAIVGHDWYSWHDHVPWMCDCKRCDKQAIVYDQELPL